MRLPAPESAAVTSELWAGGEAVMPLPSEGPEDFIGGFRPAALIDHAGRTSLPGGLVTRPGTAAVILTSGSTGAPKGVELSHEALMLAAEAVHERIGAKRGDRWVCCLPLQHIGGFALIARCTALGTRPEVHERFEVARVAGSEGNLISLVPTMLSRLLEAGVGLARFKAVLLGGASCPPSLLARARNEGANVIRTYGMTETGGGVVYDGEPLAGVEVRIQPDGRVALRCDWLFSGYRCLEEQVTDEDGWLITSDLGRRIGEDGKLEVLGRADDVIITGGENVSPSEVENLIRALDGVEDAVVVGVPDEEWGQRVVVALKAASGVRPPTLEQIRDAVRKDTDAYKAPKTLVLIEAIPYLSSGKPDRNALKAGLLERSE